ncbi:MAG: 16S rRNA (cytosine(1402)-N(4))-methyltransferase RsmH [Aestuariivita sp.]|nr:16S rRNA (cytosine(1402)-N(4))-methyltransferase RsmH [Aestuariivita sp.]
MTKVVIKNIPGFHVPVLLEPFLNAAKPVSGTWIDGTFGAGGYSKALLEAGADYVIAIDRDATAFKIAKDWLATVGDRIKTQIGLFSKINQYADRFDGVVFDLGFSSMQVEDARRGFSFQKDGPLDMRMSQQGISASDVVNNASEANLSQILLCYGDERKHRKIAQAIVRSRAKKPIVTTQQLVGIITACLPFKGSRRKHPATRSFQALRIAVNDEVRELAAGLIAAERGLRPGGKLAVITFHSIEDRLVKHFFQQHSCQASNANRYAPEMVKPNAPFCLGKIKLISPDSREVAINPRCRSAKLRFGIRTDAPATNFDFQSINVPKIEELFQ